MNRRSYLAATAAVLTSTIAGCGNEDDGTDSGTAGSPPGTSPDGTRSRRPSNVTSTPRTVTDTTVPVPEWVTESDADYYVDIESGDNANVGRSNGGPFADLRPFESDVTLEPGDRVVVRGGVYEHESEIDLSEITGTADSPVVFEPYRFEDPVLDFSANRGHGITLDRAQHVVLRGLEIRHADRHNVRVRGAKSTNSGSQNAVGVVIENCEIHGHGTGSEFGDGIFTGGGADRTTIRGCELYDGKSGGNSDGLHLSDDSRNTVVERTVCHNNSDDGVDFGARAAHDADHPATLRNVLCYRNGSDISGTATGDGVGIKTGNCDQPAGGHKLVRCVAFENENRGIGGPCTDVPLTLHNCTAVQNRNSNIFVTANAAHEVVNCISQGSDGWDLVLSPETTVKHCNWDDSLRERFNADDGNGVEVPFQSMKPESAEFLRPAKHSRAFDTGVKVGIEYLGDAPDWGAFEVRANSRFDPFN